MSLLTTTYSEFSSSPIDYKKGHIIYSYGNNSLLIKDKGLSIITVK